MKINCTLFMVLLAMVSCNSPNVKKQEVEDSEITKSTDKIAKTDEMKENKFCFSINVNGIFETIDFEYDKALNSLKGNGYGELDEDGISWSYSFTGDASDLNNIKVDVVLDTEEGTRKAKEVWSWPNMEKLQIIAADRGKKRSKLFNKVICE